MLGPVLLIVQDMTISFQAVFGDHVFCLAAHFWCMLLVVKILNAAGSQDFSALCFH